MYNWGTESLLGTCVYCQICQSYIGAKSYKTYAEAESVLSAHMAKAHPPATVNYFEYRRPTLRELLESK